MIDGLTILNAAQLAALPPIQNSIANVVDADELPGDDAQEASDDAPATLQLTAMAAPLADTPLAVGDRITYTLRVDNPENLAEGVVISADLSANLQLDIASVTPSLLIVSGDVMAAEATGQTTPLQWTIDSLPSGGDFQAQFAVIVQAPGDVNSSIQVSATGTDTQTVHLHHLASAPEGNGETLQKLYLPLVQR